MARQAKPLEQGGSLRQRTMIGWREWAGLPDFTTHTINAKIDTGAKSSALHACAIKRIEIDGAPFIEFTLHPAQYRNMPAKFCRAPFAGMRTIRSSNGHEEERPVITSRLQLGDRLWKVDLTLTNREAMEYRLLIGRDALGRKFLVNPGASYLLS